MIGPATVTTPTLDTQPIIEDYVDNLLAHVELLDNIFYNFPGSLNSVSLKLVARMCDTIFQNDTMYQEFFNQTILGQSEYLKEFNVSLEVSDWMIQTDSSVGSMCIGLLLAVKTIITATASMYKSSYWLLSQLISKVYLSVWIFMNLLNKSFILCILWLLSHKNKKQH